MSSQVARVDGLRSEAAGSITTSYTEVGTSFAHPMRIVKLLNNTNADCTVSFDGTNDNDFVPANGFSLYDGNANKNVPDSRYVFAPGTTVFVKSSGAPSTGSFYVVCLYGQGE